MEIRHCQIPGSNWPVAAYTSVAVTWYTESASAASAVCWKTVSRCSSSIVVPPRRHRHRRGSSRPTCVSYRWRRSIRFDLFLILSDFRSACLKIAFRTWIIIIIFLTIRKFGTFKTVISGKRSIANNYQWSRSRRDHRNTSYRICFFFL